MMTTPNTFQQRLKHVLGPQGYNNNMRRSVQTVLLYEANRCLAHTLDTLRPFQRKAAIIDQAHALLDSLDFITPQQKSKIFWRTVASQESLTGDIALRRVRNINKELEELCDKIKPFVAPGRSHDQAVDMLLQTLFLVSAQGDKKSHGTANTIPTLQPSCDILGVQETSAKDTDCLPPALWEHRHNHVITAFRLYYNGDKLDHTFPPPCSPREIHIPTTRPRHLTTSEESSTPRQDGPINRDGLGPTLTPGAPSVQNDRNVASDRDDDHDSFVEVTAASACVRKKVKPAEDRRRRLLQEVHEHLNLLKMFEGVIPDDEITQRKKELFLALPNAPPTANKKSRMAA